MYQLLCIVVLRQKFLQNYMGKAADSAEDLHRYSYSATAK